VVSTFVQGSLQVAELALLGKVGVYINIGELAVLDVLDQHIVQGTAVRADVDGVDRIVHREVHPLVQINHLPDGLRP